VDAPYAKLEELEPSIARVLAHNPSAFTYYGTQTYLIGTCELAVIDPGPDLPEHLDALEEAIAGRTVAAIMCTHTHRDHSPAARPLAERTGAAVIGCAPLALETVGPRADASFDGDYAADRVLEDGEELEIDGRPVRVVATPGHRLGPFQLEAPGLIYTTRIGASSTLHFVPFARLRALVG